MTLTPIPLQKPDLKIYYQAQDGKIMHVTSVKDKNEFDFEQKVVSWNEGKDFLSGHKNPDEYFINIHSLRKELVKKNLVQIYGHGSNIELVDLLDHNVVKQHHNIYIHVDLVLNLCIVNTIFKQHNLPKTRLALTEYKNPLKVYGTITTIDILPQTTIYLPDARRFSIYGKETDLPLYFFKIEAKMGLK